MNQSVIWDVMELYGVDSSLIALLKDVNENAKAAIKLDKKWENRSIHVCAGEVDSISPRIFITHLDKAVDKAGTGEQGISVHGVRFSHLKSADDIDVIEEDEGNLERFVNQLNEDGKRYGLTD